VLISFILEMSGGPSTFESKAKKLEAGAQYRM